MSAEMQKIVSDYRSALGTLTNNSRTQIQKLTILASKRVEYASEIVKVIEEHLQKLEAVQLPVLYLVDSIVKHLEGIYLKRFAENIAETFRNVFVKPQVTILEDGKRKAWVEYQQKILELQRKKAELENLLAQINIEQQQDPEEKTLRAVHVRPEGATQEGQGHPVLPTNAYEQSALQKLSDSSSQQSVNKRRSDESAGHGTVKKMKSDGLLRHEDVDSYPKMQQSRGSPIIQSPGYVSQSDFREYYFDMNYNLELNTKAAVFGQWSPNGSTIPGSSDDSLSPPPSLSPSLDVSQLFQKLVDTGIVSTLTQSTAQSENLEQLQKESTADVITFDNPKTLKKPANFTALYAGPTQCGSCGERFLRNECKKYREHLDWHFRQNRREKESRKKRPMRAWYFSVNDWAQSDTSDDKKPSWFEEPEQQKRAAAAEDCSRNTVQPSVPSTSDRNPHCVVCHDGFEEFYNEDEEEWHLRPAVRYANQNYHPLCLDDSKVSIH
ncbi:pre-mRNA cleavage complex 2 protein Pcf11-like [Diachasma alloeum]|uniref:pre-mRNA cleavage complex 2 protein Pcf11-like n=1 Tax=Diachasma alloeum TaxID=454923 RepID=UPI0010FAFF55|nr:pre-mRNA cleavage complex 2 protein Pcf11-like [Diachasma alloeum]